MSAFGESSGADLRPCPDPPSDARTGDEAVGPRLVGPWVRVTGPQVHATPAVNGCRQDGACPGWGPGVPKTAIGTRIGSWQQAV